MTRRESEFEHRSNRELLDHLSHEPSPINLHLYQPPRLLSLSLNGKTEKVFDITGTTASSPGFNHQITRECYLPLTQKGILADENVSWNLYGVTADWLDLNYPQIIRTLKNQVESGSKPPVGDTYLHIILPFLGTDHKDMLLTIGKRVYRERWGVDPETIWLPESAVDSDTLSSLAKGGILGVHLREHQTRAQSPGNLFAVETKHGKILIISGHNHLSGRVGFDKPWADAFFDDWSGHATRLGYPPRISIDGETLGHWWKEGEGSMDFVMYLLRYLKEGRHGKQLDFSSKNIPDAGLIENTSWSCLDTGLGRWKGDTHCQCGLPGNEHQAHQIRASKKDIFEKLLVTNTRIDETLDSYLPGWREVYIQWFLSQRRSLAGGLPVSAEILKDKAIERLFLSAYIRDLGWTSCGWFFGDVVGFERQIPANSLKSIAEIMNWPDIIPNG